MLHMNKLRPAALGLALALAAGGASAKNIVEVAESTGMHKTFVKAVTAAGLAPMLEAPGAYTVFAPTDDAFAALPAGTVETLLKPENKDKLKSILQYHVIAKKIMAADIPAGKMNAKSAEGADLKVDKEPSGVTVDDAKVIKADVPADNGVIHVVDKVLMPPK